MTARSGREAAETMKTINKRKTHDIGNINLGTIITDA